MPLKKKERKKIAPETFQPLLDKDWDGCHQLMARRRKIWITKQLTKSNHAGYGRFPIKLQTFNKSHLNQWLSNVFCNDTE